jgi:hypothetical protein
MNGVSRSVVSAGLVVLLGVGSAWAQQPVSPIEQQHRRGITMLQQGQNEQALVVFREIYERTREPRALWRMATAETALGRWVEAEGHMSVVLGSSSDAWVRTERAGLEATLHQVQARVGLLTVRCNVPGATIEVGGRPVTIFPVHVVAGDVQVSVRAEGYQTATTTVGVPGNVERAFVQEVNLLPVAEERTINTSPQSNMQTPTPAPPRPAEPTASVSRGSGVGPWILMGAGGVGLILSGISYLLALDAESQRDASCPSVGMTLSCESMTQLSAATAAENRRDRFQTTAVVSVGIGASFVAAGLLWHFLSARPLVNSNISFFAVPSSSGTYLGIRGFL